MCAAAIRGRTWDDDQAHPAPRMDGMPNNTQIQTTQATTPPTSPLATALLTAAIAVLLCGCATTGPATAAGVIASIDCEAAHLDEDVLADARIFADAKVEQWLAGGARPSAAKIRADLAPVRSNLMRCAVAGAVAAAIELATSSHPPAEKSVLAQAQAEIGLREAFGEARRKLGWGTIRLRDGEVI